MSLATEILEELWNLNLGCKGVRVNIFGVPRFKEFKKTSMVSTLSRLNSKGFVIKTENGWQVTKDGEVYLNSKRKFLLNFDSPFKKGAARDLIIMFDVPESKSHERFWLRKHLKKFGYTMIQKSVWVGPSPLPKDFMSYLKEIGLNDCVRKFKLASKVK